MATVLIIATDPVIGDLLGQLTDLAGHVALFRRRGEEPGPAIREARPSVVLVDAASTSAVLSSITAASSEAGAQVVYFASTMAARDLRRFALDRKCNYFELPAGPKLLRQVLTAALREPSGVADAAPQGQYAVTAAAVAVARARVLVDRSRDIRSESRTLRAEHEATLAESRRSYATLREAVIFYTRELRGAGIPPDRTLDMVRAAVTSDVATARANGEITRALDDAVEWCLQAYYAA
jgi:DNA-binding response OmpR family regulator